MEVNILTKNPGKIMAAKKVFKRFNIDVNQIDQDFLEIQAENSLEIARFAALETAKKLNIPIIREDHSLYINALGIPGPYTSFFERKLSAENLLKILKNFSDRTGYFEVATVLAFPSGKTKEYTFKVPCRFAEKIKDKKNDSWNSLIILKNEKRTLAEYPEMERIHIWGKNYALIAKELTNRKAPRLI